MILIRTNRPRGRRAMILMVVLALMTLFAIVGISFVYVANAQEASARVAREAETQFRPQIDPEAAFAYALGQIIYDCNDTDAGVYSALRGHSLARNMYGWNPSQINDKPYTGFGRISYQHPTGAGNYGCDDLALLNYLYYADLKIRDPERYPLPGSGPGNPPQYRAAPTDPVDPAKQPYIPTGAVPYTYPDHNNLFLAQIDPFTGKIVAPSYHRDYYFGDLGSASNTNFTSQIGKYKTLRPTDQYHTSGSVTFARPLDSGGDVKNLDGVPGGADSIWIDIGAPVMVTNDGRKYKMLVAPLILDLDGRLDLNVIGNLMGGTFPNQEHRSNQGWGAWEINPQRLLNVDNAEWRNIYYGSSATSQARYAGRYDTNNPAPAMGQPDRRRIPLGPAITGGRPVRGWSQVDYNGRKEDAGKSQSTMYGVATAGTGNAYNAFPDFTTGTSFSNGGTAENPDHASIYWPYNPRQATTPDQGSNRRFPLKDLVRVLRDGGLGSDMQSSDLRGLLKSNLWTGTNATRRRNQITLLSADLDRPGATPYVWDPVANNGMGTNLPDSSDTRLGLKANGIRWSLAGNNGIPFPIPANFRATGSPANSEFDAGSWRNTLAGLRTQRQRVNLLRNLYLYPTPNATTGKIDLADMTADANGKTVPQQYQQAVSDRQQFAADLFEALRQATGAGEPSAVYSTFGNKTDTPEFRAIRALAQLAVNIVDYIDVDDYLTVFEWCNFTSGGNTIVEKVVGFEMPRLVLNETYVQYDNEDGSLLATNDKVDSTKNYNVNVWAELYNPVPDDSTLSGMNDTIARLAAQDMAGTQQYPMYRIVLAEGDLQKDANAPLRDPGNFTGDPDFNKGGNPSRIKKTMSNWGDSTIPKFVNNKTPFFNGAPTKNERFYVVAPDVKFFTDPMNRPSDPNFPQPTLKSTDLTYTLPANDPVNKNKPKVTILLQRLAFPPLPEQPNPGMPNYNPFVTIDFVEHPDNMVEDGRYFDTDGANPTLPRGIKDRQTYGRSQPYTAAIQQRVAADPKPVMPPPAMESAKNTFYRQNSFNDTQALLNAAKNPPSGGDETMLRLPHDWLIHLDRNVINPAELLHVSGLTPHLVTQEFGGGGPLVAASHGHVAPWGDQTSRLYRFLEFVTVAPRGTGNAPVTMDRVMGKVNINSVWSADIFRAIADPQQGNSFFNWDNPSQPDKIIDDAFRTLIQSRSTGVTEAAPAYSGQYNPVLRPTDNNVVTALGLPMGTPIDRPIWSLAMGYGASPAATASTFANRATVTGLDDTILRANWFNVPDRTAGTPPPPPYIRYQKAELLTKVFGQLTTRSNVYAVWLTVGFFEVTDDSVTPPRLGLEIGKDENKHVRYRMFAIVDRTNLSAFETTSSDAFSGFTAGQERQLQLPWVTKAGPPAQPPPYNIADVRTGREWTVTNNVYLTFDPNTDNEETVRAYTNGSGQLVAVFQRTHGNGCKVICRGNPGPMSRYDPRNDIDVVPFFMLID